MSSISNEFNSLGSMPIDAAGIFSVPTEKELKAEKRVEKLEAFKEKAIPIAAKVGANILSLPSQITGAVGGAGGLVAGAIITGPIAAAISASMGKSAIDGYVTGLIATGIIGAAAGGAIGAAIGGLGLGNFAAYKLCLAVEPEVTESLSHQGKGDVRKDRAFIGSIRVLTALGSGVDDLILSLKSLIANRKIRTKVHTAASAKISSASSRRGKKEPKEKHRAMRLEPGSEEEKVFKKEISKLQNERKEVKFATPLKTTKTEPSNSPVRPKGILKAKSEDPEASKKKYRKG